MRKRVKHLSHTGFKLITTNKMYSVLVQEQGRYLTFPETSL